MKLPKRGDEYYCPNCAELFFTMNINAEVGRVLSVKHVIFAEGQIGKKYEEIICKCGYRCNPVNDKKGWNLKGE